MNYKQRAKMELETGPKAVLKEEKKAKILKATDPLKYATQVAPTQLNHIMREIEQFKDLIPQQPNKGKLYDALASIEETMRGLDGCFRRNSTEQQQKTLPAIVNIAQLGTIPQLNTIQTQPNTEQQPRPLPIADISPNPTPLHSSRSNSSQLYIPPPVMLPALKEISAGERRHNKPLTVQPSELIEEEAKVMLCDVQLSALRLFNPIRLKKEQKRHGAWAVVTTNPLLALAIKYFDIANQYNPQALRNIKQVLFRDTKLDWALKNGDIEANITTERFNNGDYVKKLFVQTIDRLMDESVLSLLENYDLVESVLKVVLKQLLISQKHANEKSNFDNVFRPEDVFRLYKALEGPMDMKATRHQEIIAIELRGKSFRIETSPDCFETYLEEETSSKLPIASAIDR